MPIISRFYGIVVRMYYNDHAPPHFHATYASSEALVGIEASNILAGRLPSRAAALVADWANRHRDELRANWYKMRDGSAPDLINPLD
jgi:hypothetical protein